MTTHPDFVELFRLLEENRVDYMVVGGYAVAFHGYPRFTKDIDIFFDATPENIARIRTALVAFGFTEHDLPIDAFSAIGNILTFGVPPLRVDLLNSIDGVRFSDAKTNAIRGFYGVANVNYIGRKELIQNKRATPRAQDKVDADELTQLESKE